MVHGTETTAERSCPRCGRPVERGPRAKWCSESCRVMSWQRRRQVATSGAGVVRIPADAAESTGTRNLRVVLPWWERSRGAERRAAQRYRCSWCRWQAPTWAPSTRPSASCAGVAAARWSGNSMKTNELPALSAVPGERWRRCTGRGAVRRWSRTRPGTRRITRWITRWRIHEIDGGAVLCLKGGPSRGATRGRDCC